MTVQLKTILQYSMFSGKSRNENIQVRIFLLVQSETQHFNRQFLTHFQKLILKSWIAFFNGFWNLLSLTHIFLQNNKISLS